MEKIIEKLDSIESGLKADLAKGLESVDVKIGVATEKFDEALLAVKEQLNTVEAKAAQAPAVLREFTKTVKQDIGRRTMEHLRNFALDKVKAGERSEYNIKLYESVDEHAAYQAELRDRRLTESSFLTGSGSAKGGMVRYQNFYRARRFNNNLRAIAPVYATDGSDFQWRKNSYAPLHSNV